MPSQTTDPTTEVGAYSPPAQLLDARPILSRKASNVWEHTEQKRDQLRMLIEGICRAEGLEALVLQSHPYVHPAWVKFESWVPADDRSLTKRSWMTVTINAKPYHKFEAEFEIEWERGGRKGKIGNL